MQETIIEAQSTTDVTRSEAPVSLLDLPVAKLQIVQARDLMDDHWLLRERLEPTLSCNADGLWVLSVRRQGAHGQFEVPYIGSEIVLAEAELGLVVVLVGWHGTTPEKYGKRGYFMQKGQMYRYYQQAADGTWSQIVWRQINDALRACIIEAVKTSAPEWARSPGKLRTEYLPPAKPVTMTTYKVVRYREGRYFSFYDPSVEYTLGVRMKQRALPRHGGGFYSFPTVAEASDLLTSWARYEPFHDEAVTPQVALVECEIGGRILNYGHKLASTYLCLLRVLEVRDIDKNRDG